MNRKEVLFAVVGIFMTVIAWLVSDLIHAATSNQLEDIPVVQTVEQVTFNKDVFNDLRGRN